MNNELFKKIIIVFIAVIGIIAFILILRGSSSSAKLVLKGSIQMTLYQDEKYIEPGYVITDTDEPDEFYVDVNGFVNTNKIGVYNLKYQLYNKRNKLVYEVEREIKVIEDNLTNISIYLNGDEEEYFFVDSYIDRGAIAYNKNDDITNEIHIDSDVNPSVVGNYQVKYQIIKGNYTKEVIRKVNIVDLNLEEEIDEKNMIINLTIDFFNYSYTILPDGTKEYSRNISYFYDDVGEYEFDVYLKNDSHKKYVVNIITIDREGPVGTCMLYYDNNKTTISMNVTDSSGILKNSYNGLDFYGNSTVINSIISNVNVRSYDKYNNYRDINCKAELRDGFRSINVDDSGHVQGKSGYIVCGTNVSKENQELDMLMQSYGYKTRGAVAAAATYLAEYKYNIPYFWGGKSIAKGLDPTWGCRKSHSTGHNCSKPMAADKSYCEYGLDCGGLVRWSYIQAGFDNSILRGEDIVTHRWGNFNPRNYLHNFNANNIAYANQIKPGDIVHKPGHVAVVIGVDKDTLQVAEMTGPVIITIIRKSTGASINHQSSFTEFLLMDEFYKMYGNS